ncbi:hypothetical protein FBU30_008329 [Linnemannia zychae]|nr:hypothetical protein FBU30_008329 [Linnemannia zychae]
MPPPKWKTEIVPSHKFEFINITDFHSNSPWTRLRYTWVWIMFFKAILVLCGDIWTCTILIISGAWTSEIKPTIEIPIARWIFMGCILLSFLLLAADFRKASKVIKSQDISYAVSNPIVSGFYCLQKFDYFCFIEKIRNSSKTHDKLCFFVFFQLKGWKHLVVQAPRAIINIMTLVAFMKAIGSDFDHLDEISQILPSLKLADKFTLGVMVFTSLMFIISGLATLIAVILWIPLVAKVQGNLKEYVCHKMDKRIDNIIKKTTKERAKRIQRLQELEDKEYNESLGRGGNSGSRGSGGAGIGSSGFRKGGRYGLSKAPSFGASIPRRLKPTLPDIDVILANAHEDIRLPSHPRISQQLYLPQRISHQPYYNHSNDPHSEINLQQYQSTYPYHLPQDQYIYHESPPFPHAALIKTSSNHGARRSLSSGRGQAAAMGYHGAAHHHSVQPYQHYPSPPQRYYNIPNRKQSLASAQSGHTDEDSPVMYRRSLSIGSGGPPLSKAAQIARQYREQQEYRQDNALSSESTSHQQQWQFNQYPYPLQNQYYDNFHPHAPPLMRAVSDGPENWPAYYGFAADINQTETPSTVEQQPIYRPDSGVLPDQNDPYCRQFAMQKSEYSLSLQQHDESAEPSSSGPCPSSSFAHCPGPSSGSCPSSSSGSNSLEGHTTPERRGSSGSAKGMVVYQPDETEIEQYDHLYRGITETHQRVKATRSMSVRSKSIRASMKTSPPGNSYAKVLRLQQQQRLPLTSQRVVYNQADKDNLQPQEENTNSKNADSESQNSFQPMYMQPPPTNSSHYHTSPSSVSQSSQEHSVLTHRHVHNRSRSSSLRSIYTTTLPSSTSLPLTVRASFEQLRDKHVTHPSPSMKDYYGNEGSYSQHGFPVVHTPSPYDLNQYQHNAVEDGGIHGCNSKPNTVGIQIDDVLYDLKYSLYPHANAKGTLPSSSVLPPNAAPVQLSSMDENIKVEVYEDENMKVEYHEEIIDDDDGGVNEQSIEEIEIKDAPFSVHSQSHSLHHSSLHTTNLVESNDDDHHNCTRDNKPRASTSNDSIDRPLLPSCPPPNFHPQEAETVLLMQNKRSSSSTLKRLQRLSCESNYEKHSLRNVNSSSRSKEEEDTALEESVMHHRASNNSHSSLHSSIPIPFYNNHVHNKSGTSIPPRAPSPLPPPVPSLGSLSTSNLASTLRMGRNSGEHGPSRKSIDQVRSSVERATTSASPKVDSRSRMSSERDRKRA